MKTRLLGHTFLVAVLALPSLPGQAQDLTLFRDDGNGRGRGQMPQELAQLVAAATPTAPTLILKGVYRFGDVYHVSLQTTEGEAYRATWQAGQDNSATVANGFRIDGVEDRTVTLGLPAGVTCQQNLQSGNSCVGRSQVALSFSETAPASSQDNDRRRDDDRQREIDRRRSRDDDDSRRGGRGSRGRGDGNRGDDD